MKRSRQWVEDNDQRGGGGMKLFSEEEEKNVDQTS